MPFLLCLVLVGCASRDSFSFIEYSRNPAKYDAPDTPRDWRASDQQALQFSSNVVRRLRARANGARVTREISSSAQVAMAGIGGAGAAFSLSKSALAVLGLGSAGIPEFQGIFNAKGHAEAYTDAARMIETAQNDYYAHNQKPSPRELTQNGVSLIQRTQASVHIVEKVLSGRIPSIIEMQQATEPMSSIGARTTSPGEAVNHISATGVGLKMKAPLPPASPREERDVNARSARTKELAPEVVRDQRRLRSWVFEQENVKEFARLRKFITDTSGTPNLPDAELGDQVREMIFDATTVPTLRPLLAAAGLAPGTIPEPPVKKKKPPLPAAGQRE